MKSVCEKCGGAHSPWIRCHEVRYSKAPAPSPEPVETSSGDECIDIYAERAPGATSSQEPPVFTPCESWPVDDPENQPFGGGYSATVPLAEQIAQYGDRCEAVLDALHDNLEDAWFRAAIIRLGAQRLIESHERFGSSMYQWDPNRRDDEMFQELADYVAYGTSGPFFDLRSAR